MFYHVRFQTGEVVDVVMDMKNGNIPCMDVKDMDEFMWVVKELSNHDVYLVESIPFDKSARDPLKEPEFEFRAAFYSKASFSTGKDNINGLMFIDFYFEPYSEKDYDPIFGD